MQHIARAHLKRKSIFNQAWLLFLTLAFLSHALIPAGMMPDISGQKNGMFAMTICSGMGQKTILVPKDDFFSGPSEKQSIPPNQNEPHGSNLCSFAVSFVTPLQTSFVALFSFAFFVKDIFPFYRDIPGISRLRGNHNTARGPPVSF